MKYKALVTGNNNLIIDDFFVQMSDDFEVISSSVRYGDLMRHIKYFAPDVLVYCLYNEKEESMRQMVNIKPMLRESKTPIVIIGNKEECVDFNRYAVNVSDMDIMRPFTTASIRDQILRYLNQKHALEEEVRKKREEAERAEKAKKKAAADEKGIDDLDIASLKDALSSLDSAISQKDGATAQETAPKATVKPNEVNTKEAEAPAQSNEVNTKEVAPAQSKEAKAPDRYGDNRHILVVDDDPIMLKTVKEQLHDDYDVATAISGKIAMKFLERKKTDLILLDYEMPDENGPDVLAKIRGNDATKDIPVVFLTGVSDKEKIQEAIALKPQGYLLKPIDHDKLMDTIYRHIH